MSSRLLSVVGTKSVAAVSEPDSTFSTIERVLAAVAGNHTAMGILLVVGGWFVSRTHVPAHKETRYVDATTFLSLHAGVEPPPNYDYNQVYAVTVDVPENPGFDFTIMDIGAFLNQVGAQVNQATGGAVGTLGTLLAAAHTAFNVVTNPVGSAIGVGNQISAAIGVPHSAQVPGGTNPVAGSSLPSMPITFSEMLTLAGVLELLYPLFAGGQGIGGLAAILK